MHSPEPFVQAIHDWELEYMDSFLKDLYTTKVSPFQEDRMTWTLSKSQGFKVSIKALKSGGHRYVPWRVLC